MAKDSNLPIRRQKHITRWADSPLCGRSTVKHLCNLNMRVVVGMLALRFAAGFTSLSAMNGISALNVKSSALVDIGLPSALFAT